MSIPGTATITNIIEENNICSSIKELENKINIYEDILKIHIERIKPILRSGDSKMKDDSFAIANDASTIRECIERCSNRIYEISKLLSETSSRVDL